jgi:hypothetical protein
MTSFRLISFLLAAGALAGCGPRPGGSDLASSPPTTPATTPAGDPTADNSADTTGDAPSLVQQSRKAHGLVSRVRPRHRRVLPK